MKYIIKKYFNLGPGVFVYNPESEEGCFVSCGMYSYDQVNKALTEFPAKKISVCLNTWGSLAGLYTYNERYPEVKLGTFICPKSDYNITLPFEHFCVMESPNESYKIYDWLSVSAMLLDYDEKIEYEFQAQVFDKKVLVQSFDLPALHKDDVDILATPIYHKGFNPKCKILVYYGFEKSIKNVKYLSVLSNNDITFIFEDSSVYIKSKKLIKQFEQIRLNVYLEIIGYLLDLVPIMKSEEYIEFAKETNRNCRRETALNVIEIKKRINDFGYTGFDDKLDEKIAITEPINAFIKQGIPFNDENMKLFFENGNPTIPPEYDYKY